MLIDSLEGGLGLFPKLEFRLNNQLEVANNDKADGSDCPRVGDVMIPKKIGQLIQMPKELSGNSHIELKLIPIAKVGSFYTGFELNTINTCARITAMSRNDTKIEHFETELMNAVNEFQSKVVYGPLSGIAQ